MLRLAGPIVLAELGWMGMPIVDTMMVGRLPYSADAIGAVSLGSILFYERELDAAEFLQRRAIDFYLRRTGKIYEAAQHDLDMVLGLKQQQDFSGQE